MSSIAYIALMDTVRTPSDIGNIIRARRKRLGWDQARLAHEIGVSRQWIVDIEKGKPRAELQLILRALQALGLELMLGPGVAQVSEVGVPDRDTVTPINLDAIIEHNRANPPLGTTVFNAFNNNIFKNQFSPFDALKNTGLDKSPPIIGESVKKNPANEHLHKQFSATNRLKIGETVADSLKIGEAEKISKVISPSSKKKGVP